MKVVPRPARVERFVRPWGAGWPTPSGKYARTGVGAEVVRREVASLVRPRPVPGGDKAGGAARAGVGIAGRCLGRYGGRIRLVR